MAEFSIKETLNRNLDTWTYNLIWGVVLSCAAVYFIFLLHRPELGIMLLFIAMLNLLGKFKTRQVKVWHLLFSASMFMLVLVLLQLRSNKADELRRIETEVQTNTPRP